MTQDDTVIPLRVQAKETESLAGTASRAGPTTDEFGAVYDRYLSPIYRYILSRVRNVQEAEDLTSQTFLSALESFPRYREEGRQAAWLFTIARNKIRDSARRTTFLPLLESDDCPIFTDTPGSWDKDWLLSIRTRIASLPEDDQELIRLRYTAGLPFGEIARLAGKREEAVKKYFHRLIERLREEMEARNE
jgi:RNA polymerase sigma-70 factor, ECF subfamily